MTIAISAHGTLVARAKAATPTVWETIAELGDITPPELSRNEFEALTQNINIDAYVLGALRRGLLTIPLNFLNMDTTYDHLTGLYKAIIDNSIDGYKVTYPDAVAWVMSGQVKSIAPKAPVDGKQSADVSIRVSGVMTIGGIIIGA